MSTSIKDRERSAAIGRDTASEKHAGRLKGIDGLRRESAPLALQKSRALCRRPVGGEKSAGGRNCGSIHGAWQYLLLLGMAATPERNLKFYCREIRAAARRHGLRRVLIAGCCDYTMLAIVLEAYRGLDVAPQITASDRCGTPLFLCRWYADRHGVEIATRQSDILTYAPDEPFDIVCTDGLISNFSPDARADLVSTWHRQLRPGGCVVTTNNIHTGWAATRTELTPGVVAGLCDRAVHLNAKLPVKLDLTDERLRSLAHDFYAHPRMPSVLSADELKGLFQPAQFSIETLEFSEIAGHALKDTDETGKTSRTLNARIVAARL